MDNEKQKFSRFSSRESLSGSRTDNSRRKKSQMDLVDKVLPEVMLRLGLEKRLREHALMQVWESVVPKGLAERSRPLFIDHQHNLVVAVRDASVAQELSLMKSKLIGSLASTARSLGLELRGLRLDMKNFHRAKEPEEAAPETPLPQASEKELRELELSDHDKQLIGELSKKLAEDPDNNGEFNQKAIHAFESQLKLIEWRRRHDYPCCQRCSNPVLRLHDVGSSKLCFNCMLLAQ